jgi:hypothetical protein
VAYSDINDTQVVLGYETASSAADNGWRVQHVGWVDLYFSHPLLNERINESVRALPEHDPFAVEEVVVFRTVLDQLIDTIESEMEIFDGFRPRWDDPAAQYANEVVIRIESDLLDAVADPLYIVAAGLDYLSTVGIERLRRLAYERKSLTVVVCVPDELPVANLDEAIRRHHELSLRDVYLEVLREPETHIRPLPLDRLPTIIAVPLAMSQNPVTAQRNFTSIRAFIEALYKMILLLDAAPCDGHTRDQRMQAALSSLGKAPITLGAAIKRAENPFHRADELLPRTLRSIRDQHATMQQFARFRNDDAHSTPPTEATYTKKLQEIRQAVDDLTAALKADWAHVRIVVPQETDVAGTEDFVYHLAYATGNRIVPPVSKVVNRSRLSKGRVYLQTESTFIDLDPLFVFQACPQCDLEELFMLEKSDPSSPIWRSGRGHRIEFVR